MLTRRTASILLTIALLLEAAAAIECGLGYPMKWINWTRLNCLMALGCFVAAFGLIVVRLRYLHEPDSFGIVAACLLGTILFINLTGWATFIVFILF